MTRRGPKPKTYKWTATKDIGKLRSGETFEGSLREWSEKLGISQKTLGQRLTNLGWSVDRAFGTEPRPGGPQATRTKKSLIKAREAKARRVIKKRWDRLVLYHEAQRSKPDFLLTPILNDINASIGISHAKSPRLSPMFFGSGYPASQLRNFNLEKINVDREILSGNFVDLGRGGRGKGRWVSSEIKRRLYELRDFYKEFRPFSDVLDEWVLHPADIYGHAARTYPNVVISALDSGSEPAGVYDLLKDSEKINWQEELDYGNALYFKGRRIDLRVRPELFQKIMRLGQIYSERRKEHQRILDAQSRCSFQDYRYRGMSKGSVEEWELWNQGDENKNCSTFIQLYMGGEIFVSNWPNQRAITVCRGRGSTEDFLNRPSRDPSFTGNGPFDFLSNVIEGSELLNSSSVFGIQVRTEQDYDFLIRYQKGFLIKRCWSCLRKPPFHGKTRYRDLTLDHVVPRSSVVRSGKGSLIYELSKRVAQDLGNYSTADIFELFCGDASVWDEELRPYFKGVTEVANRCKAVIDHPANWQPLCQSCNSSRKNKPFLAAYFKYFALSYLLQKIGEYQFRPDGLRDWNRRVSTRGVSPVFAKRHKNKSIYCQVPTYFFMPRNPETGAIQNPWLPGCATKPNQWDWLDEDFNMSWLNS